MVQPVRPALGHRPLALLVDRDADTRQMYAEYLKQASCEIDEAEDGREALAKALAQHPDVIVTETRLPGISGIELCRILREDPVTRDIPIVVVTGDAFTAELDRARLAGADVVLTKPCLPAHLAEEIRRVLTFPHDIRPRPGASQPRAKQAVAKAARPSEPPRTEPPRKMLSRVHRRHDTREPPTAAPVLVCPACDRPLAYVKSHIGGVSARHQEQWDYYECSAGCGTFQYRQRTRKLRRVI